MLSLLNEASKDSARRLMTVFVESLKSWADHRSASKGAALAFYTLFSMTPILVLAIALAGHFFGAEAARGEIVAQIQGLVGPNGAQAIQSLLVTARDPDASRIATLVASVVLLLTATTVFADLKASLDEVWGVDTSSRPVIGMLLRTRLLSFGMVLVLAFLLLVSLVLSAALAMLERYADEILGGSAAVLAAISPLVTLCVIAGLFAVINKTLPDAKLSWADAAVGAAFTAGLFSLGKFAIGLYMRHSDVASSFGAAGSLVALLLWVYYSSLIFFLGAEFTRQYALAFGSLRRTR